MKQDFFKYLPSEIISNILSRLDDVRSIAVSKCVCKPWLEFLSTDEFVKLHFSRSATALAVLKMEENPSRLTVFEMEDDIDVESSHGHHYNHPINFSFLPNMVTIRGYSHYMLLLHKSDSESLYACNPMTREYIELHRPQENLVPARLVFYGFGESKLSGQHKVVRIVQCADCHVYTLGTGLWRRFDAPSISFRYRFAASGAFVNGNLHWLVYDSDGSESASCFNLETECFSTIWGPPPVEVTLGCPEGLSVLRDCLCLCDHTSENEIALWLMKDHGDYKSWTKEYVINLTPDFGRDNYSYVYPINVFKDGDVLMLWNGGILVYYSNKTKSIQEIGLVDAGMAYITSMLFTPGFLSLKSFQTEKVLSF